ncbi:hypothetical protein GCM10010448_09170 [Streptomyces glomeratus]|uniref:AB hydrolase-1 domain-containing protein n=1 Tax=Streptomyces glomeratus TaxID=284452 RepID=A0ABP6L5A7_9ACTN
MTEITRRFVETNGLRVHLTEAGTGPLVLLLHGFPETAYDWRHQMAPPAAAGYHVVAPDQRGYGRTSRPEATEEYTILHLVGDAVGLVEALGERQAVVAVHDSGGPVAWYTALLRPDLVRGVAALGSPMLPRPHRPPLERMRAAIGEGFQMNHFQQPGVADPLLERNLTKTFRWFVYGLSGDAPGFVPVVREGADPLDMFRGPEQLPGWLSEDDIAAYAAEFAVIGFTGPLNWYRDMDRNRALTAAFGGARVTAPALFIGGDKDLDVTVAGPDVEERMRAVVPDLRAVVMLRDTGRGRSRARWSGGVGPPVFRGDAEAVSLTRDRGDLADAGDRADHLLLRRVQCGEPLQVGGGDQGGERLSVPRHDDTLAAVHHAVDQIGELSPGLRHRNLVGHEVQLRPRHVQASGAKITRSGCPPVSLSACNHAPHNVRPVHFLQEIDSEEAVP